MQSEIKTADVRGSQTIQSCDSCSQGSERAFDASRCINRHRPVSPSNHSGHTECVLHTQVTSYYSNFQSIRYKYTQQIASDEPSVMMGIDWPDDGYWSSQMRCHHTESKVNGITRIWIEDGHFDRVRGTKKCCDFIRTSPAFAAFFLPRELIEHRRDLI